MTNENLVIEQQIINAIRKLLTKRVNELLLDLPFHIPIIDFGDNGCGHAVCPIVTLNSCESTEKERIIHLDTYSLIITFSFPDTPESESHCYAYAASVVKAIRENPTLDGIVENVSVSSKKIMPPKKLSYGDVWELSLTLRVTVEEIN